MISNSITAVHNGKLQTHSYKAWAAIKNVTVKYLQQRKRSGYTDDEAINVPFGKSPDRRSAFKLSQQAMQPHWRKFVFVGIGQESYTAKGTCN